MAFRTRLAIALSGLLMGILPVGHARASTWTISTPSSSSVSGTFTSDDEIQTYTVSLSKGSLVTFATDSYGGGTYNGTTTSAGGFVPVLSLFDGSGMFIADEGGSGMCMAGMKTDASTGICNDASLSKALLAGTYTLAISEFPNYPNGNRSDGFNYDGQHNFTAQFCTGTTGPFLEVDLSPCAQRNGNFVINATATASAVPEPATIWLALPILAFGAVYRKRKSAA